MSSLFVDWWTLTDASTPLRFGGPKAVRRTGRSGSRSTSRQSLAPYLSSSLKWAAIGQFGPVKSALTEIGTITHFA